MASHIIKNDELRINTPYDCFSQFSNEAESPPFKRESFCMCKVLTVSAVGSAVAVCMTQ